MKSIIIGRQWRAVAKGGSESAKNHKRGGEDDRKQQVVSGYFGCESDVKSSYNVELLFAASFDSKMECLCYVFDVKKQGKPIREVRTRYWKLREGENRLSGLLEGISIASLGKARGIKYNFCSSTVFCGYGSINKQWGSLVLVAAQNSAFLVSSIDTSSVVSVSNSNTGIRVSVLLEGYPYPL
ncbi:hypothetical protein GQ457_01G020820 [Hibiscus cannabinus]